MKSLVISIGGFPAGKSRFSPELDVRLCSEHLRTVTLSVRKV